jgi:hypothetical protein
MLLDIGSGIRQGCAISASLFILCMNPILQHLHDICAHEPRRCDLYSSAHIPSRNYWSACADDLASVLVNATYFVSVVRYLRQQACFSGLELHFNKANVILLGDIPSHVRDDFDQWLRRQLVVPLWESFIRVVDTIKYLGFMIGFHANACQWLAPMSKFRTRAHRLTQSTETAWSALLEYSVLIATVLTYKARLCVIPQQLANLIDHILCCAFHKTHFPTIVFIGCMTFSYQRYEILGPLARPFLL